MVRLAVDRRCSLFSVDATIQIKVVEGMATAGYLQWNDGARMPL